MAWAGDDVRHAEDTREAPEFYDDGDFTEEEMAADAEMERRYDATRRDREQERGDDGIHKS